MEQNKNADTSPRPSPLGAERELICPQCNPQGDPAKAVDELVKGVCRRCLRSNAEQHKDSAEERVWSARDRSIPRNQHVAPDHTLPEVEGEDDPFDSPGSLRAGENEGSDQLALFRDFLERFKTGAYLVLGYKGNKELALRCWLMALGFTDVAGAETDVALARLLGIKKKQTVTKCKGLFQARMGFVGIMPGQRDREARKRMSEARKGQLTTSSFAEASADGETRRHGEDGGVDRG